MKDTLLLNADGNPVSYLPLSVIGWQTAVKLLFIDKISVLKYYDDWEVHSQHNTVKVPSIIMMNNYLKWKNSVPFSRKNLFLRDNYRCQYCGNKEDKTTQKTRLTFDHVIPRSMGGKTNWNNIVAACGKCNFDKSDDHRIVPKVPAKRPTYYELVNKARSLPITVREIEWNDYLHWPESLVTVKLK